MNSQNFVDLTSPSPIGGIGNGLSAIADNYMSPVQPIIPGTPNFQQGVRNSPVIPPSTAQVRHRDTVELPDFIQDDIFMDYPSSCWHHYDSNMGPVPRNRANWNENSCGSYPEELRLISGERKGILRSPSTTNRNTLRQNTLQNARRPGNNAQSVRQPRTNFQNTRQPRNNFGTNQNKLNHAKQVESRKNKKAFKIIKELRKKLAKTEGQLKKIKTPRGEKLTKKKKKEKEARKIKKKKDIKKMKLKISKLKKKIKDRDARIEKMNDDLEKALKKEKEKKKMSKKKSSTKKTPSKKKSSTKKKVVKSKKKISGKKKVVKSKKKISGKKKVLVKKKKKKTTIKSKK